MEKVIVFRADNSWRQIEEHAKLEKQINEMLEAGWSVKFLKTTHGEEYATIIFVLQKE